MIVPSLESWITHMWAETPWHIVFEAALLAFVIILIFRKPQPIVDPNSKMTEAEEELMIKEWTPNPPVPEELPEDVDLSILQAHVVSSGPSDKITIDNKEVLNFAIPNYFGLNMNQDIIDASQGAIDHYAVGSCGPRQFYGTMDAHLDLEKAIARWTSSEDSVGYCYPFATTTSVIQAFIRNTDVVFIDEEAWFAIKLGSELTRGQVVVYKHQDMSDLRDKIIKKRLSYERWDKCNRWVVAEGISANDGSLLDLPALVKLRHEFCLRIAIDETHSFGVLGKTGRGIMEHFDIDHEEVEVLIGSLGTIFGSLGGFTVSDKGLCDFQRLSSHAYIFSASPPPYTVIAARKAVEIVEEDGADRISKQRSNTKLARELLKDVPHFELLGSEISPLIHLRLEGSDEIPRRELDEKLQKVVEAALADSESPVAIEKAKFCAARDSNVAHPTIKVFVSPAHSEEQIRSMAAAVKRAVLAVE